MLKKISIVISVLILILIASVGFGMRYFNNLWFKELPNYFEQRPERLNVPMFFAEEKYEDYLEPHALIKIPVQIDGIPNRFYLQFDTGTPHSLIYQRPLKSLMEMGIKASKSESGQFVGDLPLIMGDQSLLESRFLVKSNYGNYFNPEDTSRLIKLGTIGADLLVDRVVVLDFKQQELQLYSDRPEWMNSIDSFEKFDFTGRRIRLPSRIRNKEYELYWDSGCSAFGLISNIWGFNKYKDKSAEEIRYSGNSWGNAMNICHQDSKEMIQLGGANIPLRRVSYIDQYNWVQVIMAPYSKIGGWLGNKPLADATLILDTRKEEFVVLPSGKRLAEYR